MVMRTEPGWDSHLIREIYDQINMSGVSLNRDPSQENPVKLAQVIIEKIAKK
jgi:hypothetical protein